MLHFYKTTWHVQITIRLFASIALEDLEFEEKDLSFTKNTLEEEDKKQTGPRVPPLPIAGDLQVGTPRSSEHSEALGLSLPASDRRRQQT